MPGFIACQILAFCTLAGASVIPVSLSGRAATSVPAPLYDDGRLLLPSTFLTQRLGLRIDATTDANSWRISSYGRYLKVTKGSASYVADTTVQGASTPVRIVHGRLYVPAEMLARAFGIAYERSPGDGGFSLEPQGAAVRDIREGSHNDYLRIVLDLTAPAPFWAGTRVGEVTLEIPPPRTRPADWGALGLFTFNDPMHPKVTAGLTEHDWTRLVISYDSPRGPTISTLGEPWRIVIDVPRRCPLTPDAPAPPVVTHQAPVRLPPASATPWQSRRFGTERGVVRVFALQATPSAVRPALASATIHRRACVSAIAARYGARAAVNGGYFDRSGPPLGMLVINREWIKHPMHNRCVLGITDDGRALMGRLRFEGAVRISGHPKLDLAGINTGHRRLDSAIVYTRRWGEQLDASPTKTRVVISPAGTVSRVETGAAPVAIPPGGWVLSAGGDSARTLGAVRPGAAASVTLSTVPHWPRLLHAIGAGPQLVRNGERHVTAQDEQFRMDVGRVCPRTAVGITAKGNVLIAAAESADAGGLTLPELASVMWKLGCVDAMALDGGGSTTVVADGRVLNQPTDGAARAVSNALLVFGQAP